MNNTFYIKARAGIILGLTLAGILYASVWLGEHTSSISFVWLLLLGTVVIGAIFNYPVTIVVAFILTNIKWAINIFTGEQSPVPDSRMLLTTSYWEWGYKKQTEQTKQIDNAVGDVIIGLGLCIFIISFFALLAFLYDHVYLDFITPIP